MDLEQLWDRMKFDASALQRGQRRYYVPYALDDGPGDTFGIRLRKFGRYANNLFSVASAIALARRLGWR